VFLLLASRDNVCFDKVSNKSYLAVTPSVDMAIRINHPNGFEDLWIDDDEHGGLVLEPVLVIAKCPVSINLA
jgi:hypothetical protein